MSNHNKSDKTYKDLLVKMQAEYQNSEVIQCFVKTEVTRAMNGSSLTYEEIKALAASFKKEIAKQNENENESD